jgi:hypothetical protein
MNFKTCTGCNKDMEASTKNFHTQKRGKYGLKSKCKKCNEEYRKQYTSTDEYKKRHRDNMAKWRKDNPERQKEISAKNYKKHSERTNAERRERYANDADYRQRQIEYDIRYKKSGRRHEMNSKPETREKARVRSENRRQDPNKREHDYKRNAEWREKNKEYLHEMHKKNREGLSKSYVAQSMRVKVSDLPDSLYENKKKIIELKRELKKNNVKIK